MTSLTICPTCQTKFDAAGGGLCPKCLLRGARPGEAHEAAAGHGATRSFESPLPQTPPMKPHEVDKLFPELEVLDVIGQGGMGVVYKARQKNLGREVAIKLLSRNLMDDPAFAERFSREARAMAMMNHPNIISIYDFGQRGSYYYLVMEYVDGLNLRQLVTSTKVEPAEAMQLVPQLCDALQYAHD
ncbi:MAG: protein kinase domain-containing protein, partial [Pirellulaceae bacterium]